MYENYVISVSKINTANIELQNSQITIHIPVVDLLYNVRSRICYASLISVYQNY